MKKAGLSFYSVVFALVEPDLWKRDTGKYDD